MRPSSRDLYPAWLRPGTARPAVVAGPDPDPQMDRAWRVWERLRDFDRRYATYVDVAIAAVLFVLCTGWLFNTHDPHPNLFAASAPTPFFNAAVTFSPRFPPKTAQFWVLSAENPKNTCGNRRFDVDKALRTGDGESRRGSPHPHKH